jgi:hypothetical protein
MANEKNGQVYQIGNQAYYIEVCFFNGIYETPVNLNMGIIEEINIKESLNQWWTTGFITLHNDYQFLEKGLDSKSPTGEKVNNFNLISDRPDGRNKFCIRIYPVNLEDESNNEFIQKNLNDFEICHDFVVYDVEDISTQNAETKLKRYYFWDERYQLLMERNLEFSSALASKKINKIDTISDDSQRYVSPNLLLKELLKEASLYPDGSDIKIGYSEGGKINNPEYPMGSFDDAQWDTGDPNNRLFYTSFANSVAMDDINYILSFCHDKDGFPVILDLGRTTEDKKFKLKSLKKIYDESAKNQKERLTLIDTKDSSEYRDHKSRGPDFSDKMDNEMQNFESFASRITTYQFSPMVNMDDLNQRTSPYHTFDSENGEFIINFNKNTVDNFLTKAKEMFSGLYSLQNDGQLLIKNNKMKQSSAIIKNYYSSISEGPSTIPLIQMLKDFIFLNQALVFQTYGLTSRTPGNFVTVESIHSSSEPNDFWDKFLGQWLIVEVQHSFTKAQYNNIVTANKVDATFKVYPNTDNNYIA